VSGWYYIVFCISCSKNDPQNVFGMVPNVSTDDVSQVTNVVLICLGLFQGVEILKTAGGPVSFQL
jgi:hypothetical protein